MGQWLCNWKDDAFWNRLIKHLVVSRVSSQKLKSIEALEEGIAWPKESVKVKVEKGRGEGKGINGWQSKRKYLWIFGSNHMQHLQKTSVKPNRSAYPFPWLFSFITHHPFALWLLLPHACTSPSITTNDAPEILYINIYHPSHLHDVLLPDYVRVE